MDKKPFAPTFTEGANDLLAGLGLTEDFPKKIENAFKEREPKSLPDAFKIIEDLSETPNEYTFGIYVLGQNTAPNPLEEMLAAAGGEDGQA